MQLLLSILIATLWIDSLSYSCPGLKALDQTQWKIEQTNELPFSYWSVHGIGSGRIYPGQSHKHSNRKRVAYSGGSNYRPRVAYSIFPCLAMLIVRKLRVRLWNLPRTCSFKFEGPWVLLGPLRNLSGTKRGAKETDTESKRNFPKRFRTEDGSQGDQSRSEGDRE